VKVAGVSVTKATSVTIANLGAMPGRQYSPLGTSFGDERVQTEGLLAKVANHQSDV
jgi:hypothetical protein